jgi:hypothetical protein
MNLCKFMGFKKEIFHSEIFIKEFKEKVSPLLPVNAYISNMTQQLLLESKNQMNLCNIMAFKKEMFDNEISM